MCKHIPLFLILLLLCLTVRAEDSVDRIAAQLTNNPVSIGAFRQEKRLKFLRKPLVSKGVFIYANELGVLWKMQEPLNSVLFIGENRMVVDGSNQTMPPQVGRMFSALLGGDLKALAQDFSTKSVIKAEDWQVTLQPRNADVQKVIQTVVMSGDREVRTITLTETTGNITLIEFSAIRHPPQLSSVQSEEFARFQP